jgi:CPA1 family monovalent cation:H+ antiporter
LFVLIGLEVVILVLDTDYIIAGLLVIPLVLLARFIAVSLPIKALERRLAFVPKTPLIMTWGGLRGGISIALALALTDDMSRELFLTMTYIVVFFSIVAQGLTLERLVRWVREA